MEKLTAIFDKIKGRARINLRKFHIDIEKYANKLISPEHLGKPNGFYGITGHHPINFSFRNSNLGGSYFLGKCKINDSIIYDSDVRGDELKLKGESLDFHGDKIILDKDEKIFIDTSLLVKTLVHNFSHDPERPDLFLIKNTISAPYANIHGAPAEGCLIGPFATVDLTTLYNCVIGAFSYVQTGRLANTFVEDGKIWIKHGELFEFTYNFDTDMLCDYIIFRPDEEPCGQLMDFAGKIAPDYCTIDEGRNQDIHTKLPPGASINKYAVFKGQSKISENVLVAQRAFVDSSYLGKGANAQENCYIINSRLEGFNVSAHGATIIHAHLEKNVFSGFNSFLAGSADCPLKIGEGSVIMPHTIIHVTRPLDIPSGHLVWGYIKDEKDLENHMIALDDFAGIKDSFVMGNMKFKGNGEAFVNSFKGRIKHILEANGAFFDGKNGQGHAQKEQNISFNIIQPYPKGSIYEGIYPTIEIRP